MQKTTEKEQELKMKDEAAGKCPFGFGAASGEGDQSYASVAHSALAIAIDREDLPEIVKENIAPGSGDLPTGRCLCGKISYRIKQPVGRVFAYHDAASRRWTGGVSLMFMTRSVNTTFSGWGHLVHWPSSERQVNCFCRVCGSSIMVRYLQPASLKGMLSIAAGTLDSQAQLALAGDVFPEEKPAFYSFAGERPAVSAAQMEAKFG